ncbi:MAG: hypothetical protein LBR70_06295 [Lactobacillaceae bacterium]|nr:hypothetical protein [Lactobacillaceae bacterium]
MKKYILLIVLFAVCSINNAKAQADVQYFEEVKSLGVVAGQGMACKAEKYDTFEMLARTILITKASSDNMQEQGMRIYSEEKANTYISKQFDGFYDCANINYRFNNQDIFNMTVYRDGTIKMPDGQIFTPRNPYDVTLVYEKNRNEQSSAQKIYDSEGNVRAANTSIKAEGVEAPRQNVQQQAPANQRTSAPPQTGEASVGRISRNKR